MSTLRQLVRDVITEHPEATPRELAEFVAKLTPTNDLVDFYTETLTALVEEILGQQRRDAMDQLGPKQKNRSAKLEQRRKWWADLLASRVHVFDTWKKLADCTVDDLQLCVDERKTHIARVEAQIINYEHLIALMCKHGARIVIDLPPQEKWDAA